MNSPVDGSWSIDPALAFDPKQLTIAHPCYPLEPVNSLESYVKAQARPTWLRAGNAHFEAFFWAQCRYDTHEQIIWRDIRTFVLDREPDANVDVVVPRSIGSFLRQEAGHQSKQPGRGARLVILDYSFVRRLLQLDAHHDRDDIRDLVRRRLPELDPQLCPLRDAQFVCTYEVDGVKGVVWFPLGYAWQKHRINVHEAEVGGEPNVDIPEATDRGTYADFLSHRAIIHLDPRPCAILLRDNSDRWNDDRCDAAVSQAANAVSCIIEMLAFDIRTDAIAAGSEPAPFNFVDDTHYAAVREDFSREALSVGYEDYTYPHHPRNFSIPRLLFLLGQRDADGGFGTLDAWVNDNIEGSVTTLFERACGGDSVTTFGNLLLGAHLHGVAPDNEVVTWPGLLALTTDVRRRAFYADEPQGLKAFQDVGVGFGLYRGYRRDLLWASIYQELVRRDAMPDQRDKSILSSMISLNTSRVDAINRIIKTYAPSTNTATIYIGPVSNLADLALPRTELSTVAIFERVWSASDGLFHCFAAHYTPAPQPGTAGVLRILHPMVAWMNMPVNETSPDLHRFREIANEASPIYRDIRDAYQKSLGGEQQIELKLALAPNQAAVGGGFQLARIVLDLLAGGDAWQAWWTSTFEQREAARYFWSAHRASIFDWGYARALRSLERIEGEAEEAYVKVAEHQQLSIKDTERIIYRLTRGRVTKQSRGDDDDFFDPFSDLASHQPKRKDRETRNEHDDHQTRKKRRDGH